MEPADELDPDQASIVAEPLLINMGPAHPATHGTVRIVIELDGERIVRSDVQVGYLHRGFEKMAEGNDHQFLMGGGACGKLARSVAWERTALGAPGSWPACLKTRLMAIAVDITR